VADPVVPAPTPQVDTVYLTTPAQQTVVVKKTVRTASGENDGGESEGSGGDD
jgi:hypothetical protein